MLIKGFAFLSIIRWYNIGIVAFGQYLAAWRLLNPEAPARSIYLDLGLHLLVLSTAFNIAAGFLINAFYDVEKDLVNRPGKTFFGRLVSAATCLRFYFLFNVAALGLALSVSWQLGVISTLLSFGMWLYSHKLKKTPLLGNFSNALLTIAAFLQVAFYYRTSTPMLWIYVGLVFLVTLIRELIKDVEALKGDVIFGYHTVPADWGMPATRILLFSMMALIALPIIFTYQYLGWHQVFIPFGACMMLGLLAAWRLLHARSLGDYGQVNELLKILIVVGVLSMSTL